MVVHETREPLYDKAQTGKAMYNIVEKFSGDLEYIAVEQKGKQIPVVDLSLSEYFDLVKKIPYRQDTKPKEVIARPYHLFKNQNLGLDCKKKNILMAGYLHYHGIPYRFVASSKRPDKRIHHVFTQGKLQGDYKNLDVTYQHYKPFEEKTVTAFEILKR